MSSGGCNSNHCILIVLISLALAAVQGCDIYRVNGDSMSPTFEDGNLIVGLRIRQGSEPADLRGKTVVLHSPVQEYVHGAADAEKKELLVKRCIAVPGDTVAIVDGVCYNSSCEKRYGGLIEIDTVRRRPDLWTVITNNRTYKGDNILNMSPVYVPRAGDEIVLTDRNIALYKRIICLESGEESLNAEKYSFKQNYYFVCGDNMLFSYDSRQWGFVPEHLIISKIIFPG